ncbi:MAG: hypothetical protein ABIR81_02775 [Ginsengibacter sp.]
MKHLIIKQKTCLAGGLIACCFILLSFTLGGDSYSVYLNSKLVFTAYEHSKTAMSKPVDLNLDNMNDKLVVEYSQCGAIGTGRRIMVKDENNKLIKEWTFTDKAGKAMIINVKDILHADHQGGILKLYYASARYLPEGRFLTILKINGKAGTKSSVAKK